MKYALVATVMAFVIIAMGVAQAQPGCTNEDISAMCSRESGLCGLAARALTKGTVLLGYTREKGCPTELHVHVFKLQKATDKSARVRAFLYPPGNPAAGKGLTLRRHGPGEYMTPIKWDVTQPMELAVRTMRRGMKAETVYFKLDPGMEPLTK